MKNTLKNKNKNLKLTTLGFTLIELLAVIVILAIIALIATPIILGIVEDARKDSFMRSVELVVGTTDIDIFSKDFTDSYTYTITDGVVSNLEVGVKNTEGMNGKIKYDKNGNDTYAIHNGKYCVIKTTGMKKAEIKNYVEGECEITIPTDEKYFTYEETEEYEYEIIDKDACVEFHITEWDYDEDEAISICNNEPYDGMTLTEWLASGDASQETIDELKEVGVIEEINISGIEITGYSFEGPKDVVIPKEINGKEVVSIGNFAFSNMSLTSIELPKTLTKISHSAFSTNLFTNITLPNNLETIEDYAFCYNNLDQTSVNNITNINEYAYCTLTDEDCFTYEDIGKSYEIIDKDACIELFSGLGAPSDEVTSICNNEPYFGELTLTEWLASGDAPQEEIDALKEVGVIKEILEIEIIGYNCSSNDIVIPNKIGNKEVVSIGEYAFKSYLYSGNIQTYVNKGMAIPVNYDFAIEDRIGTLTSVAIPDSVTYIDTHAFAHNLISKLKLSSKLTEIAERAFMVNEFGQVVIPNSVTNIGIYAFYDGHISDLIISDNNQLEEVGDFAFSCVYNPYGSKVYQIIQNINGVAISDCNSPK